MKKKTILTIILAIILLTYFSYVTGYVKSENDHNNIIKYSYCVETKTSVEIVNVYFKNYGKDKEKDDISYFFDDEKECTFLGLSTFANQKPALISHTDWGCEHKQEMIKRCKKANENR